LRSVAQHVTIVNNYALYISFLFVLLCWWAWGLNLGFTSANQVLYCLNHTSSHFALVILRTIYLGCPRTTILPMSASQIARIIGMNHRPGRVLCILKLPK
jgi:Na+-driven multidrug efflux pump